jgi:hypothetical protein
VTTTVPSTKGFPIHAGTKILGIETSCDETAAAVVVGGHIVRSSIVSSQVDIHARFGGVVPEIASRAHVDLLTPVIAEALVEAGLEGSELDAVPPRSDRAWSAPCSSGSARPRRLRWCGTSRSSP